MNAPTAIVLGIIVLAAAAAVAFIVHRSRTAGSSSCTSCSLRSLCNKK